MSKRFHVEERIWRGTKRRTEKKIYIVTYYNHNEHWGAIESAYTSKRKAEKTIRELRRTSNPGGVVEYEIEELEISKTPQVKSKF